MRNRTFTDLDQVVALDSKYGLGRVMPPLPSFGSRLAGVVTATGSGNSIGRIHRLEGGIAWGNMRNCVNQLIARPSMASAVFEYRFSGDGELSGYNLGNLMLKVLNHLSMRPSETISSTGNLLEVDAFLIPMSEQSVDLMALGHEGHEVYGEMNIDQLDNLLQELMLTPPVPATHEAVEAIAEAGLILIGPGSFYTSLPPILLLDEMVQALRCTPALMMFTGNLGEEYSPATRLSLTERIAIIEHYVGKRVADAVIAGPKAGIRGINDRLVIQTPLEASDMPYHHDRALFRGALEKATQLPGWRCAPEGQFSMRLKILRLS